MTNAQWKSDTRVRISESDREMTVVGRDSVGSVICEWSQGEQLFRGYVTPTVLVLANAAEAVESVS